MKSQKIADKYTSSKISKNRFISVFVGVCLWLIFALPIAAQNVSGIVTDTNNAPIQNAEVSTSNQKKTLTNTEGKFSLDVGNTANTVLKITANGFASFEKTLSKTDFETDLKIVLEPQNLRDEVTVSITNTETRLSETPASVVVLTRETLNATAAQNVDDVLRQIAGFNLFRRSSSKTTNPTAQGANFRGLAGSGASRSAVLLDGVSVNDAFGGWTYWTRIPRISIEQIETLRGGASSLYGDAALSGAINLQTEKFESKPIFRFETSAGSQKTFDGSAFGAYGKNGWNISASFDAFRTDGYIPVEKNERGTVDSNANSRFQNSFLTLEKRFSSNKNSFQNSRIFVRGNYFTENRENGTRLTNNQTRFRQITFGVDFGNETFGAFQFRASIDKQLYDQTFSAISNNRNTETLSRIQRVPSQSFGADLSWRRAFSNHFVSGSVEFREVRGTSDEIIFQNNRASTLVGAGGKGRTFSISAQDFWRVTDKLNLSFGARFDAWKNLNALSATRNLTSNQTVFENFQNRTENALSPRIAALYQINQNFSLYGSYSKSFRGANLNELYRDFRVGNVLTLANENLRAERAGTFETGLNFAALQKKINLRGNFFVTEISRPVVSITLTNTPNLITRQRQNVGKTLSRGLELDAEFTPFAKLKFSASYLFTDSRVTEFPLNAALIDKFLPQVARQQITFQTLYRPTKKLTFSMQSRFSSSQFEDDLNTLKLRPFSVFDVFSSYKFKKFEIFNAIENLLNSRYDIALTPNRTVASPRFVRFGLRFFI